ITNNSHPIFSRSLTGCIAGVVLISDGVEKDRGRLHALDPKLDQTELRHHIALREVLQDLAPVVYEYFSIKEFLANISRHATDVVIPCIAPPGSRNRYALLPAVCESQGVMYAGADAFTKALCQDKHLSKLVVRSVGLDTPNGVLIQHAGSVALIETLKPPLVVKPNQEGGSLGISQRNLVSSHADAAHLATELLQQFRQPCLVEEFVPGREVSVCILGNQYGIHAIEAAERYVPGNEDYLSERLFDFTLKNKLGADTDIRLVTPQIENSILQKCKILFRNLGRVQFFRIDGRLSDGGFTVLELTPDTHLGERAEFCGTLIKAGLTYTDVVRGILNNCLDDYRSPDSTTSGMPDSTQTPI
ncbi:hypothetical protein, partial [Azospirillum brasilense]|uniref:hypothetical protein n=1 Tax=Azospirillum brasilense TaxID=192 RepID=UPI0013B40C66